MAGELVLFNSDDGTYHTLNAVGSHLWRAIAAGGTLASVTDSLCLAYQQDEAVIAADVRRFIEHALDKKLLKTHALAL